MVKQIQNIQGDYINILSMKEESGMYVFEVQLLKDGTIIKDVKYNTRIDMNKIEDYMKHIGEMKKANNGFMMRIIKFRAASNIDIQFEDGSITYKQTYYCFQNGKIRHPKGLKKQPINNSEVKKVCKERLGEKIVNRQGLLMEIIEYRTSEDMDVQFQDGTIVKHRRYEQFRFGTICNCNYPTPRQIKESKKRVGEWNIALNGMRMQIIAYRGNNDIDIQFEDRTIVRNKSYKHFREGLIGNPNCAMRGKKLGEKLSKKAERLGEENRASNGMRMKIIAYRRNDDIDVQFEDEAIREHVRYQAFTKGAIAHPDKRKR